MSSLVTTYQLRLPRGPHESVLSEMSSHLGLVERHVYRALEAAHAAAKAEIEALGGLAAFKRLRDANGKRLPHPVMRLKNAIKVRFDFAPCRAALEADQLHLRVPWAPQHPQCRVRSSERAAQAYMAPVGGGSKEPSLIHATRELACSRQCDFLCAESRGLCKAPSADVTVLPEEEHLALKHFMSCGMNEKDRAAAPRGHDQ